MNDLVLVVDDDLAVREALGQTLMLADLQVITAGSYIEAKDHISRDFPGAVISDIRMPGKDGFALLSFIQSIDADIPVVLLTGEGDIPMAVRGIQSGAFSFLEKPCETSDLLAILKKAFRSRSIVLENRMLKQQLERGDAAAQMIFGESKLIENLRSQIRLAAKTTTEVLISGAPGTGISKVAEVLHLLSSGSQSPFEKRAAAGLTIEKLEAGLQSAAGGTFFINEIAAMPADTQFYLLEALEQGTQTRIIAGTEQDLKTESHAGRFNSELFYRLGIMHLNIPALKERPEDIPVIFRHYVRFASEQSGLPEPEITPLIMSDLMAQNWPGNARALMNAAMRFVMGVTEGDATEELGLAEQLARVEHSLLSQALERHNGNATEAAKALKLPRKTFYDKLARHQIRADLYR